MKRLIYNNYEVCKTRCLSMVPFGFTCSLSLSGFTEAVYAYAENHDHVILVTAKDITGVN